MKRAHGHFAFALVATALAALTAGEALRLRQAQRINTVVAAEWSVIRPPDPQAAPAQTPTPTPSTARAPATSRSVAQPTATLPNAPTAPVDHLPPEARLAHAVALSRVDYDGALAAYKAIIQSNREDLRRLALYDLGNLNLRQAVQNGLDEPQSLPLTELAKQNYRDLLRRDPTDWDARYNLERALRLAPEDDDDTEDTGPPDPRQHERTTIADPRMDLP